MQYYQAFLIICGAFSVPAAISYVISRQVEHESRRRIHEVGIAVFLQMGVIFAVIVAFVFTNVWDQFNDVSNAVHSEAADLQNMADRAAYYRPMLQKRCVRRWRSICSPKCIANGLLWRNER